jgi:hypothetical protein
VRKLQRQRQTSREQLRQRLEDAERRRQEELERPARLAREAIERQERETAQRRREDVRIRCELSYDRYATDLATRFPRAMFQDYLKRYLWDDRPADEVERRGVQLDDLILFHVAKIDPPKKCQNIEDLSRWYMEEKRRIDTVDIDPMYKATYLAQINARYAELTEKLLSEMTP